MDNNFPKISIITVTFNADKWIEMTMQSVFAQTYPNIEYIIVDGLSKDKTLEIVQNYNSKIAKIIVEKDKNNYDAMNKGLRAATGDYVWFLHAGDVIPNPQTLYLALENWQNEDFIYGKAEIQTLDNQILPLHKPHPEAAHFSWQSLINGMIICHQSMLMKRAICVEYNFENYRIAADLDWSIRCLKQATTFKNTNTILCTFLAGGLSNQHRKQGLKERFRILKYHFGLFNTIFQHARFFWQSLQRGSISNH
jgi:glycosyltransferase involved in cell wall biosynthesis